MTSLDKLQAVVDFVNRVDKKTVKEEDFLKLSEALVHHVKKIEAQMLADSKTLADLIRKVETKITVDNKAQLASIKEQAKQALGKSLVEQNNTLNFVRDKVRNLDTDLNKRDERILSELISQIPEPEVFEYEHPSAEAHRDELESLKGEERLSISAIRDLEERLEALKTNMTLGRSGGGTSAVGVKNALGNIIKTETPTGDIDGANTTYTVSSTIFTVFSFAINGMTIHSSEYSIAGKTITFTTALPASLSGTSFEIVYA